MAECQFCKWQQGHLWYCPNHAEIPDKAKAIQEWKKGREVCLAGEKVPYFASHTFVLGFDMAKA